MASLTAGALAACAAFTSLADPLYAELSATLADDVPTADAPVEPYLLADANAELAITQPQNELAELVPSTSSFHIDPLDVHKRTSLTVVEQLRTAHYLPKTLDDNTSSATFDKYLESLDGGRSYLLASDIAEFEPYRYALDDALKRGTLGPAFEVFNRYQNRVVERIESTLADLEDGIADIDFDVDEALEIDRTHAAWPRDMAAADDLWRRRLKANVLSMKLNGKELSEIRETLTKRYKNRLKQAKQIRSEDAFQVYMNAFAATFDPHTQYLSPRTSETFNINMSLSLEGIGAVLGNEDDYTKVMRLVTAGPADKSGQIEPNDLIVSVAQGDRGELIDVVGWRLDDVVELIRGPKGSVVRLEVKPADSQEHKEVRLVREAVQLEDQSAKSQLLEIERAGVTRKIGIIEIPTFYVDIRAMQRNDPNGKSTTRDVRRLIQELRADGAEALVIDLRNNGGGSLQEADTLTGLFIKSGPTVQVKTARRRASVYADRDNAIAWDGPMAVLVNRLSASASEIFAGAIQDYGRGLVIGSQTFGKGTVQTLIPLNRGQLKITQAKFYRISGQSTQHQGIIPNIEFPELYDVDRIGESSYDDALPWDVITPAIHQDYADIDPLVPDLRERHEARTAVDPDFSYLRDLSERSRENREKTHISLSEKRRIAEKEAEDAWRLALENRLLSAKGEPQIKSLDDLEDAADEDEEPDPADDAMLRESGEILLDYMRLQRQIAQVEHRTG
ncbi:MAG: carboxy terminal-processing peptidase [Pseudomonadota bacterium]